MTAILIAFVCGAAIGALCMYVFCIAWAHRIIDEADEKIILAMKQASRGQKLWH